MDQGRYTQADGNAADAEPGAQEQGKQDERCGLQYFWPEIDLWFVCIHSFGGQHLPGMQQSQAGGDNPEQMVVLNECL
jgi:hypothetical protein